MTCNDSQAADVPGLAKLDEHGLIGRVQNRVVTGMNGRKPPARLPDRALRSAVRAARVRERERRQRQR